jgi:hypothetical protein
MAKIAIIDFQNELFRSIEKSITAILAITPILAIRYRAVAVVPQPPAAAPRQSRHFGVAAMSSSSPIRQKWLARMFSTEPADRARAVSAAAAIYRGARFVEPRHYCWFESPFPRRGPLGSCWKRGIRPGANWSPPRARPTQAESGWKKLRQRCAARPVRRRSPQPVMK